MLDAQAKAAYGRRLEELREELEEAREFKNEELIAKADDEIEPKHPGYEHLNNDCAQYEVAQRMHNQAAGSRG